MIITRNMIKMRNIISLSFYQSTHVVVSKEVKNKGKYRTIRAKSGPDHVSENRMAGRLIKVLFSVFDLQNKLLITKWSLNRVWSQNGGGHSWTLDCILDITGLKKVKFSWQSSHLFGPGAETEKTLGKRG